MRLIIIGAGFAGMYAALSAARLRDIQGVSPEELEIALVAPEPTLVVRPRLYEPKP
jgi:NADH dehydrogenase